MKLEIDGGTDYRFSFRMLLEDDEGDREVLPLDELAFSVYLVGNRYNRFSRWEDSRVSVTVSDDRVYIHFSNALTEDMSTYRDLHYLVDSTNLGNSEITRVLEGPIYVRGSYAPTS